jgi:hypothetical protein
VALISIRAKSTLATTDVLAPERYDPRRALDWGTRETVLLGDVVNVVRRVVQPAADLGRCLVLDTSDVREGIVIARKTPVDGCTIGSAKKVTEPHDVIVSRLRPYLRQVAFLDHEMPFSGSALLVCSTEFFVLRSPDNRSIAFLVPFLLSRQVQEVLAASQEGGHHPRFNDSTLLTLPVAMSLLNARDVVSRTIEECVAFYRKYERGVDEMIYRAQEAFA